jgi:hypothetical protein
MNATGDDGKGGAARRRILGGTVLASLALGLSGCFGWVPFRQAYWDAKVKEMCEKDGGVTISEKLHISKSDIDLLGRVDGKIGVPMKDLAHPNAPAFAVNQITILRDGNPGVWRSEWAVTRRVDQVIIARVVIYNRSGGDFPSPAHESRFTCPDLKVITSDLQQLFVVEGDSK